MSFHRHRFSAFALALVTVPAVSTAQTEAVEQTVKVFILAGQSNMEGKAKNKLLEHQATDEKTKHHFAHLREDGEWVERDDVFIKFLKRKGPLTIGYGSPNKTGCELEFGHRMGEHYQEPVILIKAAWGGHSLFKLFRSPSAGMPPEDSLQADLEKAVKQTENRNKKRNRNDPLPTMETITEPYGRSYRNMLAEVKDVRENFATMFPSLAGRTLEIAGFVWFQGWNDMFGAQDEYESNMKHFIKDVRKDLGVPNLPFVIGVMGQNGSKPAKGGMVTVQNAQLAMAEVPEFKGNVKAVRTDVLADKAAEKLFPTWKQNFKEWELTGSDRPYHYLGSAIWFTRIGKEFAVAMIDLLDNAKKQPKKQR